MPPVRAVKRRGCLSNWCYLGISVLAYAVVLAYILYNHLPQLNTNSIHKILVSLPKVTSARHVSDQHSVEQLQRLKSVSITNLTLDLPTFHQVTAKSSVSCWEVVGQHLAQQGYRVVLLDLWSNPGTTPEHLAVKDAADLVSEAADFLQETGFVMLGKSWGGSVAIQTAIAHPTRVSDLVLVAPALKEHAVLEQLPKYLPVLLLWAEDDEVMPVSLIKTYQKYLGPRMTVSTTPKGGHNVLSVWSGTISDWLSLHRSRDGDAS